MVDDSEKGDLTTEAERLSYDWVKKHYNHCLLYTSGAVGGLCHGNDVTRTEEQQHFVQRTADIVVSGGQDLFIVVVHSPQAQELHGFCLLYTSHHYEHP